MSWKRWHQTVFQTSDFFVPHLQMATIEIRRRTTLESVNSGGRAGSEFRTKKNSGKWVSCTTNFAVSNGRGELSISKHVSGQSSALSLTGHL